MNWCGSGLKTPLVALNAYDTNGYGNSVRRLAALQPKAKLVLGTHNLPIAPPSVLEDLADAFERVQTGQVQPKPAGVGKVIYQVGDISFLMRPLADIR